MQHKPSEYKHIAAWGRYLGGQSWYTRDQQEEAAMAGAPLDAIYESDKHGRWVTFSELPTITQRIVERYME